jgi:hypothetical protein
VDEGVGDFEGEEEEDLVDDQRELRREDTERRLTRNHKTQPRPMVPLPSLHD